MLGMTNFKNKYCEKPTQYSFIIFSSIGRFIQISSVVENACSNQNVNISAEDRIITHQNLS